MNKLGILSTMFLLVLGLSVFAYVDYGEGSAQQYGSQGTYLGGAEGNFKGYYVLGSGMTALTGNAVFVTKKTTATPQVVKGSAPAVATKATTAVTAKKTPTIAKAPFLGSCKYIELERGTNLNYDINSMTPEGVCQKELGTEFGCVVAYTRWTNFYFDLNCSEFKFMEPLYSESSSACLVSVGTFMKGDSSNMAPFGKFNCTKKAALSDGWNQVGTYGAKRGGGYISGVTCCK